MESVVDKIARTISYNKYVVMGEYRGLANRKTKGNFMFFLDNDEDRLELYTNGRIEDFLNGEILDSVWPRDATRFLTNCNSMLKIEYDND